MDKTEKSFASEQGDFFQQLDSHEPEYRAANAPDLDIKDKFRVYLKESLKHAQKYGISRDRVVERINLCLPEDGRITPRQLNGWLAASAEDRPFPAEILPAFIWATRGNLGPITVLTEALGLHLMDEQEALAAELGETVLTKARIAQRERALRNKLGG